MFKFRLFRYLLSLILILPLASCAGLGFFAANIPSDYRVQNDIAFSDGLKLDVYTPQTPSADRRPVIVFFYGGRWETGRRQDYRFVADRFVREGFIVVIPDYRKYPDVKFPAFVEDGAAAVSWVSKNIGRYGGDGDRLFLLGHSAGAHIAALLASDEQYLQKAGVDPKKIAAFAGLAGPYAFTPDEPDLIDMFGPPQRYPQMQVPTFIDGHEPPMLLLHGADDTTVKRANLDRLADVIQKKGGFVETKIYPGIDHVGIAAAMTWIFKGKAPVAKDVTAFFNAAPHRIKAVSSNAQKR